MRMTKAPLKRPQSASQTPYKALTPIEHDLKRYAPGEVINLTDGEAGQLLEVNAVAPIASASLPDG
jgi:hypothetical protein